MLLKRFVITHGRSEQSGYFGNGREHAERSKRKSQTLQTTETAHLPTVGQEPLPHHPSRPTSISAGNVTGVEMVADLSTLT